MKIFLQTFGCKTNQYDTELLREKMESGGGMSVRNPAEADLCVVNSCSVTAKADEECRQFVRRLLRVNATARVIVTGCYASHAPAELRAISPRVEVYTNKEKETLPACLGFEVSPETFGLTRYSTRARAFVKIQDGCKAPCHYCIIPTTRPDYWNKPVDQVLKEVGALVAEGHGEIVFTGIRLGLYRGGQQVRPSLRGERVKPDPLFPKEGRGVVQPKVDLVGLLKRVIELPGEFRVRLSSLEVTEISDALIDLVASTPKICRHFHIPMQSADDGVLKAMGRWYQFQDYADVVSRIRRSLPDCGLTADVMTGYPTETDEAFETGFRRIRDLELSGLHVFPFSSRPGTRSAALKPLPPAVQKARVRRLMELAETLKANFRARFAGTDREVLAEPSGEGWTDNYVRVRLPKGSEPGRLVHATL
jgi:threonylcarbamoyladenosine tRNA methylthiotransferase MtaB